MQVTKDRSATAKLFVAFPFNAQGRSIVKRYVFPELAFLGAHAVHGPFSGEVNLCAQMAEAVSTCTGVISIYIDENPNVLIETGIAIALAKPLLVVSDNRKLPSMLDSYPSVRVQESDRLRISVQELVRRSFGSSRRLSA